MRDLKFLCQSSVGSPKLPCQIILLLFCCIELYVLCVLLKSIELYVFMYFVEIATLKLCACLYLMNRIEIMYLHCIFMCIMEFYVKCVMTIEVEKVLSSVKATMILKLCFYVESISSFELLCLMFENENFYCYDCHIIPCMLCM